MPSFLNYPDEFQIATDCPDLINGGAKITIPNVKIVECRTLVNPQQPSLGLRLVIAAHAQDEHYIRTVIATALHQNHISVDALCMDSTRRLRFGQPSDGPKLGMRIWVTDTDLDAPLDFTHEGGPDFDWQDASKPATLRLLLQRIRNHLDLTVDLEVVVNPVNKRVHTRPEEPVEYIQVGYVSITAPRVKAVKKVWNRQNRDELRNRPDPGELTGARPGTAEFRDTWPVYEGSDLVVRPEEWKGAGDTLLSD